MYTQSIDNIKTIIIPIDGIIYDLNRYRYEYCKELDYLIDLKDFHYSLGDMYTMYNDLSIQEDNINEIIEKKVEEHIRFKNGKCKDGIMEIFHYCYQKKINIAVISTHYTKQAITYLKKANLYNMVKYIAGRDYNLTLSEMISQIITHFQNSKEEVLVLAPFDALIKASNENEVNVIYVEDLLDINEGHTGSVYNKVKDLYEVLNLVMFEKYESYTMFSQLLGMNSNMNKDELSMRKEDLYNNYKNDKDVLSVIDHTYQYHISQLNEEYKHEQEILDVLTKKEEVQTIDEPVYEIVEKHKEEVQHKDTYQAEQEILGALTKKEDVQSIDEPVYEIVENHNEEPKEVSSLSLSMEEGAELSRLIGALDEEVNTDEQVQSINEESVKDETFIKEVETYEEQPKKKKRRFSILRNIGDLFECILLSIWIIVISLIVCIIAGNHPIVDTLRDYFVIYYSYIEIAVEYVLNGLHQLNASIPSYAMYLDTPYLFSEAIVIINVFISNTIILFILKKIKHIIFR